MSIEINLPQSTETPQDLQAFADSRGLPVEYLEEHGIHICPDDGPKPGWIAIPYPTKMGKTWHTRYRYPGTWTKGVGPKFWQPEGTQVHLYNPLGVGPNSDLVVFAEGEPDTLVLCYLGYPAVGIPGIQSVNLEEEGEEKRSFHHTWALLFEHADVLVAFDNDERAQKKAIRFAKFFRGRVLPIPAGIKDVNEWFLNDRDSLERTLHHLTGGWK